MDLVSSLCGRAGVAPCEREPRRTYGDVIAAAERIRGALLRGRSSLEGGRVAVLAVPGESFIAALFAVVSAGGCALVLSTLHPVAETTYFCADAEVETILVSAELAPRVQTLVGHRIVTIEEARTHAPAPAAATRPSDAALQLYTSGTTGKPKGAVLTHENLAVQQALVGEAWGWSSDDVLVHALPLHHMHGLAIALLTAIGAGASVQFVHPFDAARVWDAMERATVFMAVPTMYNKLFAALDAADAPTRARWEKSASKLRLATSGSAALPVTLGQRWREITGAYPLERFGMTEIGVGCSNPLVGERRPGTVGMPLPTVGMRIVDDELWISGPSVFSGYWKRESATAEAFVIEDGTRWFRTGDTVARDADGYVRILGRTSVDILKSGGYKLSALEIEEALREHPGIAEVAVVGLPDETWGEKVVACVVPRAGAAIEEDEVRAFCKNLLAPYKVPRKVIAMTELPRNALGKVMKPELVKKL
jgi:malonyl-CoA/methylmalonyl-CoA synthetase